MSGSMASLFYALLLSLLVASSVCKARFNDNHSEKEDKLTARQRALKKLQEVFGFAAPEGDHHAEVAPQFMIELYNTIADPGGVTHGRTPYNAKVVRSFIERDNSKTQFFFFNISGLSENEKILEAELHLYRMRSSARTRPSSVFSSPNYLIRVYQVLDSSRLDAPDEHRLLNVHYVGAHASGWQVFNVKQAVLSWTSGAAPNLGLIVTASTLFGEEVNVRFARRNEHHNSKQPILVLFDDEPKKPLTHSKEDSTTSTEHQYQTGYEGYFRYGDNAAHRNEVEDSYESEEDNSRRRKRSLHGTSKINATQNESASSTQEESEREMCTRREMYVDFEHIGWSDWIVAPAGYSAYYCKGRCDYPLELSRYPTNHATVQSIVHHLGLVADVSKPCCVPSSLKNLTLLYLDENSNVIMKVFEDMVADSCGCH
ncbi:bone morphogenetic protein 2 [Anabrus simplex]|uniref:bone morphogenetic protein 2 n=1 Tax=Anabrus simplex TaxID=316456 RepID=UPI0035A3B7E2